MRLHVHLRAQRYVPAYGQVSTYGTARRRFVCTYVHVCICSRMPISCVCVRVYYGRGSSHFTRRFPCIDMCAACMCACFGTCTHVRVRACTCAYARKHIAAPMHMCGPLRPRVRLQYVHHAYMWAQMYVCADAHGCVRVCVHMHVHMSVWERMCLGVCVDGSVWERRHVGARVRMCVSEYRHGYAWLCVAMRPCWRAHGRWVGSCAPAPMRAWSIAAGVYMSAYVCVPIRVCLYGCVFISVNVWVYNCVYLFARMRMRAHAHMMCVPACVSTTGGAHATTCTLARAEVCAAYGQVSTYGTARRRFVCTYVHVCICSRMPISCVCVRVYYGRGSRHYTRRFPCRYMQAYAHVPQSTMHALAQAHSYPPISHGRANMGA
jgi:hypothetical protein